MPAKKQKLKPKRGAARMEDADFVADSEDELQSEEDLAARAVADSRAVVAVDTLAATFEDDDPRQQQHDGQHNDSMQGGGDYVDADVDGGGGMRAADKSHPRQQSEREIGSDGSSGVIGGAAGGGEQALRQHDQMLFQEPNDPTNQEPTVMQQIQTEYSGGPSSVGGSRSELDTTGVARCDAGAHSGADVESSDQGVRVFKVGDLIEVESRTWPGINKPGGSGRVVNVHQETNAAGEAEIFYDVRYVLGGFERRIESEYVELSHILQLERAQGRVRFERVFYHDEFADDLHKKKRVPYEHDAFESNRRDAGPPSSGAGAREPSKRKRPSSGRRRSNDSDGAQQQHERSESRRRPVSSESEDDDEGQVIRRIGDNTFVMGSSSKPDRSDDNGGIQFAGGERKRTDYSTGQRRDQDESDKRRRRRIVESDDDSSDIEYQQPQEQPRHFQQQPQEYPPQQQQQSHHRYVERTRVRASKKRRRYVGGYLHSGDDVDATFIQPEDNANALPDDVAREIGFKLGKTKAELKAQLATIASLLTANLRKFKDQKDLISQKIKRASALSTEELRDFYRQTTELEHFLTQSLIRGGEDVMNAVIVKLTRKGGSLPDSVELVFDDQKREISDLGVWIRKVLSSLETAFKVRGESLPSDDRQPQQQQQKWDDGEPVSSSESDHHRYQPDDDDFDSNSFQYEDGDGYYDSRDMGASTGTGFGAASRKQSRHTLKYDDSSRRGTTSLKPTSHRTSKKSQAIDTFMASFDGRRASDTQGRRHQRQFSSKVKYASTLDDFDFIQYSFEQQHNAFWADEPRRPPGQAPPAVHEMFRSSNFRFPSKKKPMAPSDPRWNWLKIGSLKSQDESNARAKSLTKGAGGMLSAPSSSSSSHAIHQRSHKRKHQDKLIGHVQSVRLQLRDKRLQGTRSNSYSTGGMKGVAPSFVPGYGYDPPSSAMPMASRKESMSFSGYQQQQQQQQQYSRTSESMRPLSTTSSFEHVAASAPAKSGFFKDARAVGKTAAPVLSSSSALSSGPRINWESVFDVLSGTMDDEDLPGLRPERRHFLMTCGLLECCCGLHQPSPSIEDIFIPHDGEEDVANYQDTIKSIAFRLRQCLSGLRFQEFAFMSSLSGGSGGNATTDSENVSYADSPEWHTLVESANHYHTSLAFLVRHAVQSVQDQLELQTVATSVQLTKLVRAIVLEISRVVAQLPDCESLFGSCPSYVFFFEVADRNAKTTPLLTAITRTYWYSIQLLINLKATAGATTSGTQGIESVIESILPTNRAVLAASLFLVDLYLYLPSSYRIEQSDSSEPQQGTRADSALPQAAKETSADTPAISLWLLLYDCFASGKCLFQAGKLSASGDGRDFWAFLQTMYRDHFIDNLAIAFIQERSSGGYLVDSIPKLSKALDQVEDVAEGQLLALQSVWDLCILFSLIFPTGDSKERDDLISEARWAVVKDLLQPGMHAFLPFSSTLTLQNQSNKAFTVYSNVLERLLEELWEETPDSSNQADQQELVELSPFWVDLLLNTIGKSGNQLSDFVNARKWDTADHIDMLSGIILVQILKFEKAIHRNRFRQPICRAISARFDATKPTNGDVAKAVAVVAPLTQLSTKSVLVKANAWNWGGSGPANDSKKPIKVEEKVKVQQPTVVKRGRDEEHLMVSILLALAVSSICQDTPGMMTSASGLRDPAQRANKSLKRDLEFYYKEMARIMNANAEFGVLLGQALYVMGRVSMEYSNEYPIIFSYLNDHLLSSAQALRNIQRTNTQTNDRDTAATAATPSTEVKRQTRLLQRGVLSSLYLMRDLTQSLCEIIPTIPEPSPSPSSSYAMDAVRSSLSFILNAGLEACLDAAVDELVSIEALNVALEILQCVLPRAPDEPVQCLQVVTSTPAVPAQPVDEFDEFDDDLWANVDLDTIVSSGNSVSPTQQAIVDKTASLKTFEEPILQSILTHLRIGLQRAVIKYPQRGLVSYHELYAIELLGVMVSTCSFQFGWSLVSASSMKPRVLAPRLFSAILKHHPEKEWFSTCFLSESGADQELANIWLMGTLDLQALFPSLCTLQTSKGDNKFAFPGLVNDEANTTTTTELTANNSSNNSQIRYSNYWVMLTDAIIFNILRENQVAQYKMDPLLLELLKTTATNSKFVETLQSIKQRSASSALQPPSDLLTLYELHLDIFQEVCRSAGAMWRKLTANPTMHRSDMNRFRLKMMDFQSGVFATFPEAYEINLKMVCQDLDRARHNWYDLSEKFLRDFATTSTSSSSSSSTAGGSTSTTNYHSIDESLELAHGQLKDDPGVRILIVLFKFMYGCVDTFLYHCGAMAIGQQNIFFSVMKLMFRQASCAEFPQAEKRLRQLELALAASQQFDSQQSRWFDNSGDSKTTTTTGSATMNGKQQQQATKPSSISPACLGFVESVRLFFARQKYPSLIHWFSQTLETYQTVKRGWSSSPLRKLLLNVLDPHGPLGIHSYYPIEVHHHVASALGGGGRQREFDVRKVRREAFYLSCGLFFCRCTNSYEHSRRTAESSRSPESPATAHVEANARLRKLRKFILNQFVQETLDYAAGDQVCLHETLVPLAQFLRAVLSHCNMNLQSEQQQQQSEHIHHGTSSNREDQQLPTFDFQVREAYYCLESILLHCVKTFQADRVLQNSISCVLVLELCGIVEEMVVLNDATCDNEVSTLLELALAYFQEIFAALGKTSSNALEPLFATADASSSKSPLPTTSELLATFRPISSHGIHGIKQELLPQGTSSGAMNDEYGISRLRVRADLVVSIGRLVERCRKSSDLRLHRFVEISKEPEG